MLERRRVVVPLYQGTYEQRLADLSEQVASAAEAEGGPTRLGDRSNALTKAQEYDDLRAEADETAEKVTLYALTNAQWVELSALHPPREGDKGDEARGVNVETFPDVLAVACLATPPDGADRRSVAQLAVEGQVALDALGDPSRAQWMKLTRAAWAVNVRDDDLPKVSLVSVLRNARDSASEQPSGSPSAPVDSTDGSRPNSTSTSTPTETSPARLA